MFNFHGNSKEDLPFRKREILHIVKATNVRETISLYFLGSLPILGFVVVARLNVYMFALLDNSIMILIVKYVRGEQVSMWRVE